MFAARALRRPAARAAFAAAPRRALAAPSNGAGNNGNGGKRGPEALISEAQRAVRAGRHTPETATLLADAAAALSEAARWRDALEALTAAAGVALSVRSTGAYVVDVVCLCVFVR